MSLVYADSVPKYNRIGTIRRKITVPVLGAETRNVGFLGNCFTGRRDFVGVRYSAKICRATADDFLSKVT
jgi:hypothetical protein